MKKSLKIIMISTLSSTLFLFSGCSNENKTLAKNLDNTVTNLIYSATNLDMISDSDIQSFSTSNVSEQNFNNDECENDCQKNANCCENCENCMQFYQYPDNFHLPEKNLTNAKKQFTEKPISKISQRKNAILSVSNNIDNFDEETTTNQIVSFSTSSLSSKNDELQDLISTLINKRSTLLLYVNDLYKGNISVDSNHRSAINAYLNILKDNTSYFNNQKGIVSNQINQAKETFSNDSSSALVNAYIIRTNEAISTRIAKLESSIDAIDSILSILKANENSTSKSYIANNYESNSKKSQSNTNNDQLLDTQDLENNQTRISQNNTNDNIYNPQEQGLLNSQGLERTNNNTENININPNNNMPYPPYAHPNFPPFQWNSYGRFGQNLQNNNLMNTEVQTQNLENNSTQNSQIQTYEIQNENASRNTENQEKIENKNCENCENEESKENTSEEICKNRENNQESETTSAPINSNKETATNQTENIKKHDNILNEKLRDEQKDVQNKKQILNNKLQTEKQNSDDTKVSSFIAEKKDSECHSKGLKT